MIGRDEQKLRTGRGLTVEKEPVPLHIVFSFELLPYSWLIWKLYVQIVATVIIELVSPYLVNCCPILANRCLPNLPLVNSLPPNVYYIVLVQRIVLKLGVFSQKIDYCVSEKM